MNIHPQGIFKSISETAQGRIQDFFKEGFVTMKCKRPRGKGMGEAGGALGLWLCLNMYIFLILISEV